MTIIENICYLLRFQNYEAKCVQLACFRRWSTSLHSNFTWTGSSPINRLWRQKTRDTALPDGEDRTPLRIPSFWHNTGVWRTDGQTDGRICRSIYSTCKASFAARCKNVETVVKSLKWFIRYTCLLQFSVYVFYVYHIFDKRWTWAEVNVR